MSEETEVRAPIETRAAAIVGDVDFPERIIEVMAVPYDQEATVEYRGELWKESFDRAAFDGVETRPNRIKAYRDHDPGSSDTGAVTRGLVGRVLSLQPEQKDGLRASVKIAKTSLGDDTLQLAADRVLDVSVGFAVRGRDQVLDRSTFRRRIKRAFLDHLAFPDNGAYSGAAILGVRSERTNSEDLPRLDTPYLDEVVAWLESRKA